MVVSVPHAPRLTPATASLSYSDLRARSISLPLPTPGILITADLPVIPLPRPEMGIRVGGETIRCGGGGVNEKLRVAIDFDW